MRSDKPQAEPFQDWVCGEVLPAIRKDGGYQLNVKIGQLEARIASQKLLLNETCAVVSKQEQDIDHLFDDASYAVEVLRSISCYTTTQIAKEMGITAQELNRWLCVQHVQYYQSGQYMLYAEYAHRGYAKTRTGHGEVSPRITTSHSHLVWTEKGRKFIHKFYEVNSREDKVTTHKK